MATKELATTVLASAATALTELVGEEGTLYRRRQPPADLPCGERSPCRGRVLYAVRLVGNRAAWGLGLGLPLLARDDADGTTAF